MGAQRAWLIAWTLVVTACSTPAGEGATRQDVAAKDTKTDAGLDQSADVPGDAPVDVVIACVAQGHGGGHGCACTTNEECQLSGHCIQRADASQACAMPCVNGTCETGFTCAMLATATGDSALCVARHGRLCDPCNSSAECASTGLSGAACVDYGAAGSFCGVQCLGDADCGEGYRCTAALRIEGGQTQQCVKTGDAGALGECTCSGRAIAAKLETVCHAAAASACKGKRSCESGTLSACSATPKSAELCDGLDNNCNGLTDEGTCDDNSPCTADSCDSAKAAPGSQACLHDPSAGACNDGNACTQGDTCAAGTCAAGTAANCDDSNPCSDDTCDTNTGCVHTFAVGKACSDGNGCTVGDACDGGVCLPGAVSVCNDGNGCTADSCDTVTGDCTATPFDGATCSDGDACTIFDGCKGGACVGDPNLCDDGNPCTNAACSKTKGCAFAPVAGSCSDGNACTGGEACANGACSGGAAVVCSNPSVCATAACDPQSGECVATSKPDGVACSDGTVCTTGDACAGGACKGAVLDCEDNNGCTLDSCDAATGCQHTVTTGSCSDGNACTTGDTCSSGVCTGQATTCPASGTCVTSSCSATSGKCVDLPVGGTVSCDDGTACTTGDACLAGECTGTSADCDDKNECTIDSCSAGLGCAHTETSGNCSDDDACTTGDACAGGACVGVALDVTTACDDKNACTTDSCTPALGCVNANNTSACDDNNSCTVGDACNAGSCVSGNNGCTCSSTAECAGNEDGDACNGKLICNGTPGVCVLDPDSVVVCPTGGDTTCEHSVCIPATGACALTPTQDDLACDDSSACTEEDVCKSGNCIGSLLACGDNNACTSDGCDLASGCTHTNLDSGDCDADGKLCTKPDSCLAGTCVAGPEVICDDGNACTLESCDPATGTCAATNVSDGLACDDGNACTSGDACVAGACKGTAPPATVSLVAGSGTPGFADLTAEFAEFSGPRALAVDAAGVVYVADTENHRIRRIAVNGKVDRLAGMGASGFADGGAGTAKFWNPSGIAVKADGSVVYVADRLSQRIRVVSGGIVSTLAGYAPDTNIGDLKAEGAFQDGTGTAARFNEPIGIALATDGNLYVSDSGNHRIRKVTATGVVTTIAGQATAGWADGDGPTAKFDMPLGIAAASDGALYVADAGQHRIRKIVFDGLGGATVTTLSGTGSAGLLNGAAAAAQFNMPAGIAVDSLGHVYVADAMNHVVREIFAGQVTTLAGTGIGGYAEGSLASAQFKEASGIAVSGLGVWFIADSLNHRIRKISDPARACP